MPADQPQRQKYRRHGGVKPVSFLAHALLVLAIAALLAAGMFALYRMGAYLFILWTFVGSAILSFFLVFGIYRSHCHSRILAALLALVAASVFYLGMYYLCLMSEAHWRDWLRVDELPAYVVQHLNSNSPQGTFNTVQPAAVPLSETDRQVNWILFVLDCLTAVSICLYGAMFATAAPYCRRNRHWMARETLYFPSGSAAMVARDLTPHSLSMLLSQPRISEKAEHATKAVLSFCTIQDGSGIDLECPIYLSVSDGKKKRLKMVALTPEEAGVLPGVKKASARNRPAPEPEPKPDGLQSLLELFEEDEDFLGIKPVAETSAGRILSPGNIRKAFLARVWPMLLLAPAMFCFFCGIHNAEAALAAGLQPSAADWQMAAGGCFLICLTVYLFYTYCRTAQGRALEKIARREIQNRNEAYVRPDDPQAIFMKDVPAGQRGLLRLEKAYDVGFMRVDVGRRLLLFEGDRRRWRVPIEHLDAIEPEDVYTDYGHWPKIRLHERYLVLRMNLRDGGIQGRFIPYGLRGGEAREKVDEIARRLRNAQFASPESYQDAY